MEYLQESKEKTNSLNENRNIKSNKGLGIDCENSERSEDPQIGGKKFQQGFSKPASYKGAFVNSDLRWERCFQEWGLKELDMDLDGDDVSMTADATAVDGIPSVSLDIETQKRIIQPWKRCLIGKVVGKTVGFKFISYKVNELWKPTGKIQILDLGNEFFLFKFDCPDDYRFALLEGPWFIGGHHLSMRRWTPNFKSSIASVNTSVVWDRLPELPLEFFDKYVLEKVGAKIGRLIKVDNTTELVLRGRYARVCVEIATSKPLVPFVRIGSVLQKVEYEGLNMICFHCGKMTHKKENCPANAQFQYTTSNPISDLGADQVVNVEANFGPWMMVDKKKNKFRGSGVSMAAPKGDGDKKGETSEVSKNTKGDDSDGQWQVVSRSKGIQRTSGSNRFASLAEHTGMDMNDLDGEGAINARNCNSSPQLISTKGGNVKRSEGQLQIRGANNVSGSITNDVSLRAHQGRNLNRKSGNLINSGSGGMSKDNQFIVSEPINKEKGKMIINDSNGSRKSDGGIHNVSTNSISSLSKTIGGFLEGGRSSCSEISGGVASNDQPHNRNSDRANHTGGFKAATDIGYCTNEKVDEPFHTGMECVFGQSQSGIDSFKFPPFKLDLHGSGGISKPRNGRTRVRVKDVARRNSISGGNGSNGGNPSTNKKPKRSLEIRDAVQYSFGPGTLLPTAVQDKVHTNSGIEQGSNCEENGKDTL
ncbi:hypothetical protein MKX03_017341 [Papaver bracteatum]|nr:hypothetical protein MKX03_017341 [Papaver bracteatum]